MAKYTVAVAGATGYAGGEALRILAAHPDFDITCVAGHSSVGESMAKHMPHIPQLANLVVEDTTPEVLNGHDVIILALPHGASGKLASQLDPNAVVVDLGADHDYFIIEPGRPADQMQVAQRHRVKGSRKDRPAHAVLL